MEENGEDSWTEHRTNGEVLKRVEEKRSLMNIIRTRQKNCIGHILRGNSLQVLIPLNRMMPHPPPCSFGILPTSSLEIMHISALLKNYTSPGIDGINPSIARSSISLVATPLSWIFNSSFDLGLIPDSPEFLKITPIFKSCSKTLIFNYKPISVLSYFSKILEKIIVTGLSTYLDRFALLLPFCVALFLQITVLLIFFLFINVTVLWE